VFVASQTPLAQSLADLHILPARHRAHVTPPQSMSLSPRLLFASKQCDARTKWQTPPAEHEPEAPP